MVTTTCPFHDDDGCGCQAWMYYWDSLNDEQRALRLPSEIKMMNDYTAMTAVREGA